MMEILKTIPPLQKQIKFLKAKNKTIGFVPTMGALHRGHLSLIRQCKKECDVTVLSIFVNPRQFGPREDLAAYPRPKKNDVLLAKRENVDIIFYPSEKTMYPSRYLTQVRVDKLSDPLCGKSRVGHFSGVATIIAKLLNIVQPDRIFLGQKDAQQCVIVKQLVGDLNYPCKVRICPTVREADGLAISSRNQYLSKRERQESSVLFQSLNIANHLIKVGERRVGIIRKKIRAHIQDNSSAKIEYIELVNADTLEPLKKVQNKCLIALAARIGKTRLIDNFVVFVK